MDILFLLKLTLKFVFEGILQNVKVYSHNILKHLQIQFGIRTKMSKSKTFIINLTAQILSFAVSMGISFFLSPFIVKNVGSETYGFVSLGNNFISYVTLLTGTINSMASRFVTIEFAKKDYLKANQYFSSVFISNVAMSLILLIPSIFIVTFLDDLFNISAEIVSDVRALWAILFLQFFIGLLFNIFSVATFATNRLYLSSIQTIIGQCIRALIIILCYSFFPTHIWYIGIASISVTVYTGLINYWYTKKLTPQLKVKRHLFSFVHIKEIFLSGIWNSISSLGSILLEALDLLIANLFVGETAMGILSVSKTIPSAVSSLIGTIVNIFVPGLTIDFAKNEFLSIKRQITFSMILCGFVTCLPISVLVVLGNEFYSLWQPTLDAKVLQILSILTVSGFLVSGTINVIFNIFTVTNKVKIPALVQIASGVVNTITVLVLVNVTDLGIYAVAGVSSIVAILKNLIIIVPYASKCLNFKVTVFYPQIVKCILSILTSIAIGFIVTFPFNINNWVEFILFAIIVVVVSSIVYLLICTNKNDRKTIVNYVKNILISFSEKVKNEE